MSPEEGAGAEGGVAEKILEETVLIPTLQGKMEPFMMQCRGWIVGKATLGHMQAAHQ